jgi:hypothetical protein
MGHGTDKKRHESLCLQAPVDDSVDDLAACLFRVSGARTGLHQWFVAYFKPSFLPAASRPTDSRMRVSRVSGRLAI